MIRLATAVCAALAISAPAAAAPREEPFPPRGAFVNSVHRFFPDLDARLNAVRYGRWRALEIAWSDGIDADLDRRYSQTLRRLLADPPRFPPEAERVAPRFAREAVPLYHALHWAQVFEQQTLDVLASPDASARLTSDRLQKILNLYRRERWALAEAEPSGPPRSPEVAPLSAAILLAGTRLFAAAAEDLAASNFGDQRWRVRRTVADFDKAAAPAQPSASSYRAMAPTIAERYPGIADHLDRIARFRLDVFDALIPGGRTAEARRQRDERAREVARRYGLPTQGIGVTR
jgi:hypothetical protein